MEKEKNLKDLVIQLIKDNTKKSEEINQIQQTSKLLMRMVINSTLNSI